jgi:plastocyanin
VPRLLLVVLLVLTAACGGGSDSTPEPGTGTGVADGPPTAQTFTIRGTDRDQYAPATVQAKVGTLTLTMQTGGVPHDLVFADKALPGIATTSAGSPKSTTLTFARPGTFTFECTIHPGMAGKIVVS